MLSKEMKKTRRLIASSFVGSMVCDYEKFHHLMAKGQDVQLPRKMIVTGYCDLANARIKKMPETMIVHGAINMKGAKVLSGGMPKAIIVDEWADFSGSNIAHLPDNMFVGQWMNLKGSNITKLPNNLTVGWHLDLDGEKMCDLFRYKFEKMKKRQKSIDF